MDFKTCSKFLVLAYLFVSTLKCIDPVKYSYDEATRFYINNIYIKLKKMVSCYNLVFVFYKIQCFLYNKTVLGNTVTLGNEFHYQQSQKT